MLNDNLTQIIAEAYKKMKQEELKGDQHKIDANKNGKIDSSDFKILRKQNKNINKPEDAMEEKQSSDLDKACWKNYKAVGLKKKGGRMVPNCVPEEVELQEGRMAELHANLSAHLDKHIKNYNAGKLGHDSFGEKVVAAHQKISKLHGIKPEHAKEFVNDYVNQRIKEEVEHTEPKTKKEKDLAALAHPKDKITHKDVLIGRGVIKKEEWDSEEHAVSEADQINELSTKTLFNYAMKAPKTIKKGEVYPKREAGIETAMKKIAARATSEEIDSRTPTIDEAENKDKDIPFEGPYTKVKMTKQPGQKTPPEYSHVRAAAREAMKKMIQQNRMKKEGLEVEDEAINEDVTKMDTPALKKFIASRQRNAMGGNLTRKRGDQYDQAQAELKKRKSEGMEEEVEELDEKAVSQAQQKFMGMVHAYKKGEMKNASPAIKKAAASMTSKEAKKFASTKHKGLPEKVKEEVEELDEGNKENKAKKNEYVANIIRQKLHPSVLPSLKYGRRELKKEELETMLEEMGTPDIKVRKTYTDEYAKSYNRALRLNPKGASARAKAMAYDAVQSKHGAEARDALEAFHNKNQSEEVELIDELSSKFLDKATEKAKSKSRELYKRGYELSSSEYSNQASRLKQAAIKAAEKERETADMDSVSKAKARKLNKEEIEQINKSIDVIDTYVKAIEKGDDFTT